MITSDSQINHNRLMLASVSLAGLVGAVVIALLLVGERTNPIAVLGGIVGTAFFIVGAVAPRTALYWMIPITFGLDFLKRLLIVFVTINWENIAQVLAVAPVTVVGIFVGCMLRRIFIRRKPVPFERILLLAGAALSIVSSSGAFAEQSFALIMRTVANSSVYFFLPWALFQCFRTSEEIERFLRAATLIAIPVSLYGMWHYLIGIQDFELAYIRTGYAAQMAGAVIGDIRPRPFSTLSSPHAYSVTVSFMTVIAFYFMARRGRFSWKWGMVFFVHLAALALSLSRGATITGLAMICFSILFASRRGIRLAYTLAFVSLAAVVFNAEAILDRLEFWQKFLPSEKSWQEQAFRLGTLSNRLIGYQNVLANPTAWPLLANPFDYRPTESASELFHEHDLFSEWILKVGIIPVFIAFCFAVIAGRKIHSEILRLPAGATRNLGACILAMIVAFMLSQSGGSGISVFPLNFWMGVFSGFVLVLCFRAQTDKPRGIATIPAKAPEKPRARRVDRVAALPTRR